MSAARAVLELSDLDLLLDGSSDPEARGLLERAGFRFEGAPALARERVRMLAALERRWSSLYERSLARYGRGVTLVRERVCQGCHVTLPTSAAPPPGEGGLHACEGCGRLLYWR